LRESLIILDLTALAPSEWKIVSENW
jgi:hypothetical protein